MKKNETDQKLTELAEQINCKPNQHRLR